MVNRIVDKNPEIIVTYLKTMLLRPVIFSQ